MGRVEQFPDETPIGIGQRQYFGTIEGVIASWSLRFEHVAGEADRHRTRSTAHGKVQRAAHIAAE